MPQSRTVSSKTNEIDIYEYDKQLGWIYNLLKKEMSAENFNLSQKYDTYMVKDGLAKGTRLKHLKMLVSLDRLLKKNWSDVSGDDINILIRRIMDNYGNTKGKETETSRDHKKILKIFFRWYKFGSRNFREVGDPEHARLNMEKWRDMGFDMCHSWSESKKLQEIYDSQVTDKDNVKAFVI